MKINDYPAPIREAWAMHEAFRKLGYPAGCIFVHRNPDGELFVVLRHSCRQFAVSCGLAGDNWQSEWNGFAEAVNDHSFSDKDLEQIWESSWVRQNSVGMLLKMAEKGFEPSVKELN
jgi:hypothetical protein